MGLIWDHGSYELFIRIWGEESLDELCRTSSESACVLRVDFLVLALWCFHAILQAIWRRA